MKTKTYTDVLVVIECGTCGIKHAIPKWFRQERLDNHSLNWYCPNGHSLVFLGKTKAEKLRDELEAARIDATRELQSRRETERSLSAIKGHFTRLKKKVASGECPCCGAVFKNLRRHMTNKHPDWVDLPEGEAEAKA